MRETWASHIWIWMPIKTADNPELTKSPMSDRQEYIAWHWGTSVYSLNEQTNDMHSQHNLCNYKAPWDCRTEVQNMMGAKCVSNDPVSITCNWGRRNASVRVVKKGKDGEKATRKQNLNVNTRPKDTKVLHDKDLKIVESQYPCISSRQIRPNGSIRQ